MAIKKPASTSSSESKRTTPSVSRKSVRKANAPYTRKASGAGEEGDDGQTGQNGSNKPEDQPPLDNMTQASAPERAQPAQAKPKETSIAMSAEAKPEHPISAPPAAEVAQFEELKAEAARHEEPKAEPAKHEELKAEHARHEEAEAARHEEPEPARHEEIARPEPAPAASAPMAELAYAELLPPSAIPELPPDSPAAAPGKAPPGDSRSFRREHDGCEEFVLIYRYEAFLITRAGKVGTQGTWSMVEYPHVGAAANAYAHRCSNFRAQGYWDLL